MVTILKTEEWSILLSRAPPSSTCQTAWCHGNLNLDWPSVFKCCHCFLSPKLYIEAPLCLVDTLLLSLSESWMIGISRWVGQTTDLLLTIQETRLLWCEESKVEWGRDYTGDWRRLTTSISMHLSLWSPGPAPTVWIDLPGWLFVKLFGFTLFTPGGNTWYLSENIPSFLFWAPVWVPPAAWGLAVIIPFWCLSCLEANFIACITEKKKKKKKLT